MKEIERFFRPEFINRLDDVIVFRPLTRDDLVQIVEYEVGKVAKRLKEQGSPRDRPGGQGLPHRQGLQPRLRRPSPASRHRQYIEDPLSEMLLSGDLHNKNGVTVSRLEGEDKLTFVPTEAPPPPAPAPADTPVGSGAPST
jgi:ATP-dependent Clp protease ATP-binding subunit ClpC